MLRCDYENDRSDETLSKNQQTKPQDRFQSSTVPWRKC